MQFALERTPKIRRRLFTEAEISYCEKYRFAERHYAGRWAAKEAVTKALGCGLIQWNGVEVVRRPRSAPTVRISGKIRQFADAVGVREEDLYISITHSELYTAEEMSRADAGAQELGIPGGVLMERAGVAMARIALERYSLERSLVICGGGNNGGDGFVIARELHRFGVEVMVLATKDEYEGDPATNLEVLRNLDVRFISPEDLDTELEAADLIVDALLGTGFSGELREKEAGIIDKMNSARAPILAVDVPAGVDGSTGEVQGAAAVADLTVCAHAVKVGCVISPGREHAGEVVAVDIGIPPEADVDPSLVWTDAFSLLGKIPRTAEPAHKYSAGALLVVAGSRGTTGAPLMVVHGAQKTGCGIVFLATSEGAAPAVDLALTEALVYGVAEDGEGYMGSGALEGIL